MTEAYCVKCRVKRPMENQREITNRRNVKMLQGDCGTCTKKINTFIQKCGALVKSVTFKEPVKAPADTAAPAPKKAPRRKKETAPRSTDAGSS